MLNLLIVLFLSYIQGEAKYLIPDSINIRISSLAKCQSNSQYPTEVENVIVNIDKGKIIVTGTLTTSVDLIPSIKAILKVEKHQLGVWVEIPCVDGVGSCTYDDLCVHSIPANNSCPESFIRNYVPCRCPIPKETYTIPSSLKFEIDPRSYSSIYNGNYWARVIVLHENLTLTCYEVYFEIVDTNMYEEKEVEINFSNHIDRPSVKLL